MKQSTIPLLFETQRPGLDMKRVPACDVPQQPLNELFPIPRRVDLQLPNLAENDVVRHFTQLSQLNYGVDAGFYPLGSCTMKYNPKANEAAAALPGFTQLHPLQPDVSAQGSLQLISELEEMLCQITGMDAFTMQPAAGAQGEMTGLMLIRAWQERNGGRSRTKVLIPDAAHGTNPASAAVAGYTTVQVPSDARGGVDVEALRAVMDDTVACLMLTNPNTLGLFDENIQAIADIVHEKGGFLYYDGANLNATMGIVRPGDMGFDVIHLNLHKTFSTPHGGGGPGAGPVGVKRVLIPYLPGHVAQGEEGLRWEASDNTIGRVNAFHGNFLVLVKAYAYIRSLGAEGLRRASEAAVLNANYIKEKLKPYYHLPYDRVCMHEVVLSAQAQKEHGVAMLDVAKRLLDYGFHPPTVYFPMIVKEAMMIEPTETESQETLDAFIEAMIAIAQEAESPPDLLHDAPHDTPVVRLDETAAARRPVLKAE